MTKEEIKALAEKVYGECDWHDSALSHLEQFAKLVIEHEREACAKIAEEPWQGSPKAIAEQIRARGEA